MEIYSYICLHLKRSQFNNLTFDLKNQKKRKLNPTQADKENNYDYSLNE